MKLIFILLLSFSSLVVANTDDIFFDEITASDITSGELSDATDTLIAPLILLGKKSGEITVNVRMDMTIASIDKNELLTKTNQYLKTPVYNKIKSFDGDFILIQDLPNGLKIALDEMLNVSINLTPQVMKNIDPKILNNSPKIRKPLKTEVKSIINDVSVRLDYEKELTTNISIETALRYNRLLFTGASHYNGEEFSFFDENGLLDYEAENKNYLLGYFTPPKFAGVSGEKNLGFAIGNTKLDNYIILESDRKYLDIAYPSTVKIYIGENLHSEKKFTAGRHSLDIPLNIEPSLIKLQIEDIYGRTKNIAFDFGGNFSNHIPKQGQYLYFASIGNNTSNETGVYSGVEFGLNKLSKIALSTNLYQNYQQLGVSYYKLFEKFNFSNTLVFSSGDESGIKFDSNAYFPNLRTNLKFNFQQKFTNLGILQEDRQEIRLNKGFIINDMFDIRANTIFDALNKEFEYGILAEYRLSKNIVTNFSYASDGMLRFSLDWQIGENTQFKTSMDKNSKTLGIKHYFNENRNIESQYSENYYFLAMQDKSTIFNNRVKLNKYSTGETKINLRSNFSVVASGGNIGLSRAIGNGGFMIFDAGSGLENKIIAEIGDTSCEIKADSICIVKTPSNRDIIPTYDLGEIGFDKIITGVEDPIYIPSRGGVKHIVDAHKVYFVQATILDNKKPLSLLVGKIVDSRGVESDIFTDEQGVIFAQLKAGSYKIKFAGFNEKNITIKDIDSEEIDLGEIEIN